MSAEIVTADLELRVPLGAGNERKWLPGLHYNVLLPTLKDLLPETLDAGQVEVMEINHYRGGESLARLPEFQQLLRKHGDRIKFIYRPWADTPHKRLQARMYFALEDVGRLSELHLKLRDWIRDQEQPTRFWTYENHWYPNEEATYRYNLAFAKAHGIAEPRFAEAYRSERVSDKVRDAVILSQYAVVNGSPTYVINRRYSTSAVRVGSSVGHVSTQDKQNRLIELIDYLVISELERAYTTKSEWETNQYARRH